MISIKKIIFIYFTLLVTSNLLQASYEEILQAAINHDAERLEMLVDQGVDINVKNQHGDTVLMHLLSIQPLHEEHEHDINSRIHALELLLEYNADILTANNDEEIFLLKLVSKNHSVNNKILEYLLQTKKINKTNIETKDCYGNTLFLTAAAHGNEFALTTLYFYKPNIYASNDFGYTALGLARRYNHGSIAGFLIRHGLRKERTNTSLEPLFIAAFDNDKNLLKKRLLQNICINLQNKHQDTALLIASQNGNFEVVKYLLEKGANPNIANQNNLTPLLQAVLLPANKKNLELIKALISYNADIQARDNDGQTACTRSHDPQIKDFMTKYCRQ